MRVRGIVIFGPISICGSIFHPIVIGRIFGTIFGDPVPGPIYQVWARSVYPVWAGPGAGPYQCYEVLLIVWEQDLADAEARTAARAALEEDLAHDAT